MALQNPTCLHKLSRYCIDDQEILTLAEYAGIKRVREHMPLTNVIVMIPFCRRVTEAFDERDEGVKAMIRMAVEGARRNLKYSGICGQAPSYYPEFAEYLV